MKAQANSVRIYINLARSWTAFSVCSRHRASQVALVRNNSAVQEIQEMWVESLCGEDLLEYEIATDSSILAWNIPWTD